MMANMPDNRINLESDALAKLVQQLDVFIRDDAQLRLVQARNAPQCLFEGTDTVTATALYRIQQALTSGQDYTVLVIQFTSTAQAGRWGIATTPRADGTAGMQILAGGQSLQIYGVNNIKNFSMIAETGNTMPFSYQLYR